MQRNHSPAVDACYECSTAMHTAGMERTLWPGLRYASLIQHKLVTSGGRADACTKSSHHECDAHVQHQNTEQPTIAQSASELALVTFMHMPHLLPLQRHNGPCSREQDDLEYGQQVCVLKM